MGHGNVLGPKVDEDALREGGLPRTWRPGDAEDHPVARSVKSSSGFEGGALLDLGWHDRNGTEPRSARLTG
jgi:hypothetical protein